MPVALRAHVSVDVPAHLVRATLDGLRSEFAAYWLPTVPVAGGSRMSRPQRKLRERGKVNHSANQRPDENGLRANGAAGRRANLFEAGT
jgi:hypothetical protein